jgi:Kef-type K+ transport system membrane component KefB
MNLSLTLIALGALFLAGLAAEVVGRRTRLPRVTLLLGLGLLAGRSGLDLIPSEAQVWFTFLSTVALSMVAFLLGGTLTRARLAASGREILVISLVIVTATQALVGIGLWLIGTGAVLALILGALACATDPAATQDAIVQSDAKSGFAGKLAAIVAIDDAWGLIVFSLALVAAHGLSGAMHLSLLADAAWEIGGAAALGFFIGLPGAVLTGRLEPGEPSQAEALGIVFLTAGLALWLEVSFLIAAMVAGAVIVNRARHHTRPFHEIEHVQWPFMILFFILAGASLEVGKLAEIGLVGAGYVVFRVLARMAGGWLGAVLAGAPRAERAWYGPALMPQAGVAVGMALVAANQFPDIGETVLSLTIAATVVFELTGPFATMHALGRVKAASLSGDRDL